jgi:hypothetical protein
MTELERLRMEIGLLKDDLARERRIRVEAEESRDAWAEFARAVKVDSNPPKAKPSGTDAHDAVTGIDRLKDAVKQVS